MRQIAVIDDERLICDLVAAALEEDHGGEVHCALNGHDGRALLQSRQFDLALIDGVLPGVPGLVLADVAANENIPALMMSGHPDEAMKYDRFGFPYLSKPFGLEALRREAEKVMADKVEAVRRVREAVARMKTETEQLKGALAESARLIGESKEVVARAAKVPPAGNP